MFRYALIGCSFLTLAFAPVPFLKPLTDPDKAIQQFDHEIQTRDESSLVERKARLVLRMKELHETLSKRGQVDESERIRERLLLVESMDINKPLGTSATPGEILKQASVDGKYRQLLHVLYVPADRVSYGTMNDFGHWPGSSYLGHTELKPGHWVYAYPRWFIWRDGPPRD